MSRSVFIAPAGPETGKSLLALGLVDALSRRVGRVGVFRPIVGAVGCDPLIALLHRQYPGVVGADDPAACCGVTYHDMRDDREAGMHAAVERYRALARNCDAVLVVGTDYTDVGASTELACNGELALNLGAPVLLVVSGHGHLPDEVVAGVELAFGSLRELGCELLGGIVNRVQRDAMVDVRRALDEHLGQDGRHGHLPRIDVLPERAVLSAPSFDAMTRACGGRQIMGRPAAGDAEVLDIVVAAMQLPHALDHLYEGSAVITPGDRQDLLVGILAAHGSRTFPQLSGVLLTGGMMPDAAIRRLIQGLESDLPVATTALNTFEAATVAGRVRGALTDGSPRRVKAALELFGRHVDAAELLNRLELSRSAAVTPLMFEQDLFDRARATRARIVLPEGTEPRVLQAAGEVLRRDIADVILLGEPEEVAKAAVLAGVDVSAATVCDPREPALRRELADAYVKAREHKGATLDLAIDIVVDVSYAGALMVGVGRADGMVSGAVHTTAQTVRPAFEVIGRAPGVSAVSSVFFMCLADQVLVYGDCAVIPDPEPDQLADIAVSSAATAAAFGIEPRVAMLSYSTGDSGHGAGVDKVRAATALVRQRAPGLQVEGPIQYDAAVDLGVASIKLPDSQVAGRATVFVFPDLNTGNNTYKAVQRSAGALAVGPVLQGLARPVNDLSRGATVADIVTTIAITAIQASRVPRAQAPLREAVSSS